MSDTPPTAAPQRRLSAGKIALVGMLITVAGGASYYLLLDVPWIRSRAIPNIAAVLLGLGLCGYALVQRRSKGVIAASAVGGLIGVVFLLSYFVLMKLPAPTTTLSPAATAPDFTLPNHRGQQVTLSSWRGRGPVLLVFYRGFW